MTWEQFDTERYVAEAMASGTVDAIVAAGGDGTVNEVRTAGRKNDIALPVFLLNKIATLCIQRGRPHAACADSCHTSHACT